MRILLTCALPTEFNEARNQLSLREITSKKDRPRIAISDNITLLCTGIGKINTLVSLLSYLVENTPDIVIDTGTCGSLVPDISVMDIIISIESIDFYSQLFMGESVKMDNIEEIKNILPGINIGSEVVASIESSITNSQERDELSKTGASIVTWETSSVFSFCSKLKIPFLSIRGVTDSCNENTFIEFKAIKVVLCKKLYNSVKMICMGI